MKTKDLIYLCTTLVLFIVVGVVLYIQFGPKKSGQTTVEVVAPIGSEFNSTTLDYLVDSKQSRDFTPPVDLLNGLGNPQPFNPL